MGNEENIEAVEKWVNLEDVATYLSVSKDTYPGLDQSRKDTILQSRKDV